MMFTVSDPASPSSSPSSFTTIRPASQTRRQRAEACIRQLGQRILHALVAALVAATPALAASAAPQPDVALPFVPPNIQASDSLLQLMSRMARVSPTFRAQCARIAETRGLVVRMRYAGLRDDRPFNARTTVRRHQYGAMIAEVDLYVPLEPVEIVAHEFEHLVEQIQGTHLPSLARVRGSGVMELRRGEFETIRAIETGRRVLAEWGGTDHGSATLDPGTGGL
jgi:hypothetical protein